MKKLPAFTSSVEEEYHSIDPETRLALAFVEKLLMELNHIKRTSKAEVPVCRGIGTNICTNVERKRN
jgi:hypothetical protein